MKSLVFVFLALVFGACDPPTTLATVQPANPSHHAFRLRPGQDLKQELAAFAKTHDLSAAWIATCVGSLTTYHLRFANQDEGFSESGHFEIVSLTGTLTADGMHVHMSVSDSTGRTIGGHLLDGNLVYTTAEIVIGASDDFAFQREVDSTFGYRELKVEQL